MSLHWQQTWLKHTTSSILYNRRNLRSPRPHVRNYKTSSTAVQAETVGDYVHVYRAS